MTRQLLAAVALAAMAACTTIGHERVEGWPDLTVTEYRVERAEMRRRCDRYVAWPMVPLACAEFNLATKRCDIWLDAAYAPDWVVEHERLHCQGHDHVGETAMRDFFNRFQAEGRK